MKKLVWTRHKCCHFSDENSLGSTTTITPDNKNNRVRQVLKARVQGTSSLSTSLFTIVIRIGSIVQQSSTYMENWVSSLTLFAVPWSFCDTWYSEYIFSEWIVPCQKGLPTSGTDCVSTSLGGPCSHWTILAGICFTKDSLVFLCDTAHQRPRHINKVWLFLSRRGKRSLRRRMHWYSWKQVYLMLATFKRPHAWLIIRLLSWISSVGKEEENDQIGRRYQVLHFPI